MATYGIGVIGCGSVFERYVRGLARFDELRLVRCADLDVGRARHEATRLGVPAAGGVDELLADPAVDIVVNLTPPVAHAEVALAALGAGKHVYGEKPFAVELSDAAAMIARAESAGRLLGSAPDTFLGSAGQTARAALDGGRIGRPVAAVAFLTHSGAELWHPDPRFLFGYGGGPALDMGPYYVTALVNCLGPVAEVVGMASTSAPRRAVTSPHRVVDVVDVSVSTHVAGVLRFASGVVCTLQLSFDVWHAHLPEIEIYGTDATLALADPNDFDGDVLVRAPRDREWEVLAPVIEPQGAPGSAEQGYRGLGVVDLAHALDGGPHRASAGLAYHVLEVLDALERSSRTGSAVRVESTCLRPAPLVPAGVTA